ncbi:helix-turn-helix transcriptional regulator [Petroclostridium sp. X23]|uniref:helix-turn-helix transcriptional regulator n=1 Tax=Petroclostridium sp. X23 TaxID=3045146 RepID=UPI0024AD3542|nr:helix-turn-helix transcriptional regulator [Petroclostridium sp. X23]WHH61256.1 helix-turn-helix transcriptional regulator [Petroclostridium sp. X23]
METIQNEINFLQAAMTLIVKQFGDKCEVVLHDWSGGYEKAIISIKNGHVTGRKVGDCGSNLGFTVMRGASEGRNNFNYITKTKDGKIIRSSTVYITDNDGRPLGALCINYDISEMMQFQNFVESFNMVNKEVEEIFFSDVNELLDYFLQESLSIVGKPKADMNKEDKMRILKYLDEKGVFLITKSGNKICKFFNISKFTLYSYLNEIRNGTDSI